ncbi:VPA1269 family protein [Variovorax ureilyticus]|uniref:VPA1269 family protein n=1 Tax=Variovorax ureilyticus TaxID=1836198 RepID=UPI003D67DA13
MSDVIQWHRSIKSGRDIGLNTSLTELAILELPDHEQMDGLLQAHEVAVIEDLWTNRLAAERVDDRCLEAFVGTPSGALRWFVHSAVNVHLNTSKVRGLGADVRALPLPQQRELLEKLRPSSREEIVRIASTNGLHDLVGQDLREELAKHGDVASFTRFLYERASGPRLSTLVRSGGAEQSIEVLTMMRARRHLLLPAQFRRWKSSVKWRAALSPRFSGNLAEGMHEVGKLLSRPSSATLVPFGQVCLLMSTLESIDDLSASLVDAMEGLLLQITERPAHARDVAAAFRELWNERHADAPFVRTRTVAQLKAPNELRTSGEFGWLVARNPAMAAWQSPLATFVEQREATSKQAVIADLNYFCDFLRAHPKPPLAPEKTERVVHIRDVTFRNKHTLMKALEQSKLNGKRRSRILGYVREFFDWYHDWLAGQGLKEESNAFRNPVSTQDGFQSDTNVGQTFRTALPSWLLRELRKSLTANDFAFAKETNKHDWCNVRDGETGEIVNVWWPGTAIILTLLLDLPLRSHQARWLDSGDFDDVVFDLESGKEVPNPHPGAIVGRREACIRLLRDTLRQESWAGAFINTNKTATYKGDKRGYEIPYLPPDMAQLLNHMGQWNKRYLRPLTTLVTYHEEGKARTRFAKADEAKLPKIAPLFRDPRSPQKNRPPSKDKIASLWLRVLRETEERVLRERGVSLQLTERNAAGELVWKYDLHTLRVSGISAMIENGVPLEVVSEFVAGHATLVMTLWYYKNSPGRLREVIAQAHERAVAEGDFVGGDAFQNNIEKFSPFLLSKNSLRRMEDEDVAYAALKKHTGLWSIASDGICPGTSCSTGGDADEGATTHGPVPGGRRCGLCRYWITGPAFLLGQMAEANNLIYSIRKKGLQLKEARDQLIDHEEDGKAGLARQTRSRVEVLERELELDLMEWQARYSYAMNSSALLDEYVKTRDDVAPAGSVPAPLLTANSESELKLTLQQADEFVLLEHVTQMSNVMPGFKNREAQMEKHAILSKVLAENGLPPLLLTMEPEQAEVAGNLLSSMLLQYVEAQDRERLFSGAMKLKDIPAFEGPLQSLATDLVGATRPRPMHRKTIPLKLES